MNSILQILIIFLASVNLLMTWVALFRLRQPTTLVLWLLKVFISAISPILFLAGLGTAILGLVLNSVPASAIGSLSALLFLIHMIKISQGADPSTGFEQAFDTEWESRIPPERKVSFLPKRYVLRLPESPDPVFHQNISFYAIPGTDRQLWCDIWQPPENVSHSGLAFIYLHGSAWAVLDKDYGTRTFFRHLSSQGHVIMDVAYRLFPETDFMGMTHDAKHAIAWMKKNAAAYEVNPDRIVIGGGSAGGHLSLLAAYTDHNKQLMPPDLESADISVRGVISLYGQSDLVATYYHTCQHLTSHSALAQKKNGGSAGMPRWIQKSMGEDFHRLGFDKDVEPGRLAPMLGGNPDEKPEAYSLFSPITHVHKECPPTLIIHGQHDILAPAKAIRHLHSRLTESGVPVVMHLLPQTDHAFDLILPKISPSAHNAYYDVERFLALMI
jgi:acetyl esterase/lipase